MRGERDPSGWDQRRERISREVERCGIALMSTRGYAAVTAQDIARAAEMSLRTFFRYFANKEELLAGLPDRMITRLRAGLAARPGSESVAEAIEQACLILLGDLAGESDELRAWGQVALTSGPHLPRLLGETQVRLVEALAEFSAHRLGAGSRTDIRPRLVAGVAAGVFGAVYIHWIENGAGDDLVATYRPAIRAVHPAIDDITRLQPG